MPGYKPSKTKSNNVNKADPSDNRQFVFDKPESELTPKERVLSKLRKFTPEGRKLGRIKQQETQLLDRELQKTFLRNAKAFKKVMNKLPEMSSIDVLRMCVHSALAENDYEAAGRWAKELAEYEKPKLQRKEIINKDETKEMSDEELFAAAVAEGLVEGNVRLLQPGKKKSA
jgi:hypothetical protein